MICEDFGTIILLITFILMLRCCTYGNVEILNKWSYLNKFFKVVLHWSTCNANLQRRFATHVFRTNLQTCYTFESLSKTCNTLQHCKYREKSSATGRYTKMIFRATSYHCKLALQVDQCNTTFSNILFIVVQFKFCYGSTVNTTMSGLALVTVNRIWDGSRWNTNMFKVPLSSGIL